MANARAVRCPVRGRNRKTIPLHPVVEAFIAGDPDISSVIRSNLKGDSAGICRAILCVGQAVNGKRPKEDAIAAIASTDISQGDPSLVIVYLRLCSMFATYRKRYSEAIRFNDMALEMAGPATPPWVRAAATAGRTEILVQIGKFDEAEACSRQILEVLPRDSVPYPRFFTDWASLLAIRGKFAEVEDEYTRLVDRCKYPGMPIYRAYVYLIHHAVTGHLAELLALDRSLLEQLPPEQRESAAHYLALAEVLSGANPERLPPRLAAVRELMADRPLAALALAREDVGRSSGFLYGQDFEDFNLVRCELAARQPEAARRLMRLRREHGNVSYLDDLFLARADLLEARPGEAMAHFGAAYRACELYRALPRLKIELDLSCELSRVDALRLMFGTMAAERTAFGEHGGGKGVGSAQAVAHQAADSSFAPESVPTGVTRLVGPSAAMIALRRTIVQFAESDILVLITGPTGTGKELVARALHEESSRAAEPFIAINCGAITESLLESELFGHEKGAFTGAVRARRGVFEAAGEGTLFLDEIGELPMRLQAALLRVIESAEIRPVGSATSRRIACRVVAATNADLPGMVGKGTFREDLLYRLRRIELAVPPLRERGDDILPLAEHFLVEGRGGAGRPQLAPALRDELLRRDWPGNVRELRNRMERMRLLHSDKLFYGLAEFHDEQDAVPVADAKAPDSAAEEPPVGRGCTRQGRLEMVRELFRTHPRLNRARIIEALGISQATATAYLKALCREGLVEKVEPTASRRTHYFRVRSSQP